MASRMQIIITDDLDGSEGADTVRFGLDGIEYDIDLNSAHAAQLRAQLQPWLERARRAGGRKIMTKVAGSGRSSDELNRIRAWARENGYQISDRGRVPVNIVAAYDRATG